MKTLVIAVTISAAVLAFIAWAFSWIETFEAVAAVAVVLLITLAIGRLRETASRVPSEEEGQRHHRGRGGGGLM